MCDVDYDIIVTFQKCADYISASIWCRLVCIMQQQWCCALSQVSHISMSFWKWNYMITC